MWLRKAPALRLVTALCGTLAAVWLMLAISLDGTEVPGSGQESTNETAAIDDEVGRSGDPKAESELAINLRLTASGRTGAVAGEVGMALNLSTSSEVSSDSRAVEVGWFVQHPENFTVHRGYEANSHNFTYLLNAERLCADFDQRRLKILVFVETHVKNTARRRAIRKTWAQRALQKALNYRVIFLFANDGNETVQQAALVEHYTYGDVSQEDFPERFENLSIKSVMGLKYAVNFCGTADFVVKIDDDIYLHMPNVIKSFDRHRRTPFRDSLLCHRNRVQHILRPGASPEFFRVKTMKYEVGHELIPGTTFPPYCSGFSYGMSLRAARKLYEASLGTPLFFIEDAYITGFCRQKAAVGLTDHPGMTLRPAVTEHNAPCNFHFTERITSDEIQPDEMLKVWDAVNTAGFFCPK